MAALTKGIYIVGAKRTPFGSMGGFLKDKSITDLQYLASKATLESAGVRPEHVDTVVIGNVVTITSANGELMSRHQALQCGIPITVPAYAVNRQCGSGFQSAISGAQDILLGAAKIALTGGVECLSQTPFLIRDMRYRTTLQKPIDLQDPLMTGIFDTYCMLNLGQTAEKLAKKFNFSRTKLDEFALLSHKNWKQANDSGVFKSEISPITITMKNKVVEFTEDEHPRPKSTLEDLAALPPMFQEGGIITAANTAGLCDGAAAVLLASEEAVKSYNLKPLARFAAYCNVGVEPSLMGLGPVPAINKMLKLSGIELKDIDLIEINEAFSSQALACYADLGLHESQVNVNGGAIATGHPFGASGARIIGHLAHELKRKGLKKAIGSACGGGGQGTAVLLEAV